jgi:hypothetical protein
MDIKCSKGSRDNLIRVFIFNIHSDDYFNSRSFNWFYRSLNENNNWTNRKNNKLLKFYKKIKKIIVS